MNKECVLTAHVSNSPVLQDIENFDLANSAPGLLLRYARGRQRSLKLRLIVIFCGVALTATISGWVFAFILSVILITFECVEHWLLTRLQRHDVRSLDMAAINPIIATVSTLQAMGIGCGIAMLAMQGDAFRMASWVFLIGVSINSLIVARFHPASNKGRMIVYFITVAFIMLHRLGMTNHPQTFILTEIAAIILLIFMLLNLFSHLARREQKTMLAERMLIKQTQKAQLINAELQRSKIALFKREREARRLALVAEHATDSVILLDKSSTILWVNPQFSRITGYCFEEAVGHSVGDLLNGPLTDQATVEGFIKSRQQLVPHQDTIQNYRKDGTTVWMEVSQTPVFDDAGQLRMLISVERDATSKIKKQTELETALNIAKLADQEKANFLARMSHELRTPANGIIGGMELLGESSLTSEQQDAFDILQQGAHRMQVIVDDILSYCDLSSQKTEVISQSLDLGLLLQEIADAKHPSANKKGLIGPIIHLPDNTESVVWSDATLLTRIFNALIGNAIKFTESGRIDVFLRVTPNQGQLAIKVEVLDTGIGIAPEDRSRVFDQFTQADGKLTRKFDGAGLGLTIARACAHKLGGSITLCSKTLSGCRFIVSLNLPLAPRQVPPPTQDFFKNPHLTLLVAEDNRTNRLLISKMFKGAEFQLKFAEDGNQAVEKYIEYRPDLVLMDISMPHKDGLQATREIRILEAHQKMKKCPILALTANAFESDRQNCFDAGMDAFLPKPIRKKALIAAVNAALEGNETSA